MKYSLAKLHFRWGTTGTAFCNGAPLTLHGIHSQCWQQVVSLDRTMSQAHRVRTLRNYSLGEVWGFHCRVYGSYCPQECDKHGTVCLKSLDVSEKRSVPLSCFNFRWNVDKFLPYCVVTQARNHQSYCPVNINYISSCCLCPCISNSVFRSDIPTANLHARIGSTFATCITTSNFHDYRNHILSSEQII